VYIYYINQIAQWLTRIQTLEHVAYILYNIRGVIIT